MRQFKRLLFLSAMLICCTSATQAQTPVLIDDHEFRGDAVTAIDSLYNRNYSAALEILKPWNEKYPNHPLWTIWEGMELWWQVLEDLHDHSFDEDLLNLMLKSDYEAGRLLSAEPGHPDGLMIRALANGYIARHHSNREEWITSIRLARKAYNFYLALMDVRPDLPDNQFVEGMRLYYSEYLPQEYPVIRTVAWLLPDGDMESGLDFIEKATTESIFAGPEATYFMGLILLNYEQEEEEAVQYFRSLVEKYPANGYYRRFLVRTLSNLSWSDQLFDEATTTLTAWNENDYDGREVVKEELHFFLGREYFRKNEMGLALEHFEKSIHASEMLSNTSERNMYAVSNYYAARALHRSGRNEEAKKYYRLAADQNTEKTIQERAKDHLKSLED